MSKKRCVDINSKEFKDLQKELLDKGININPYILATKVKFWQDSVNDIERVPTAQDLNINPVFNRTDIEESVTADTPEITDLSESDNLNSEKNTIEKELKKLNAQINRNPIAFKNLVKFFKISNLNKKLNQVNQLLKNLNQQSEQAIAAADIVAESNNVFESTSFSVDESSNVQAINEKTRFAELPDGLKYLLAKYHVNMVNFNFGLDQNRFFEEQDYALSVLTDEIIAAIESKMGFASYAKILIDWNKANNVTAKESTEEIVDEEINIKDNTETKTDAELKAVEQAESKPVDTEAVEKIEADRKADLELRLSDLKSIESKYGVKGYPAAFQAINAKYDAELKALEETADIEEQGVVDKQIRFKLEGFRELLPNLEKSFSKAEQRAFLTEYNKITTSEERAEQVVKLQNLINDKILAATEEIEKAEYDAKVKNINANKESLRKDTNYPKKIIDDFIKSQENLGNEHLKGELSIALKKLAEFNKISKEFKPNTIFENVSEDDLFKVVTDELNKLYKAGTLSNKMVTETNRYLGTRKFLYKVNLDRLGKPSLKSIPQTKKKQLAKAEGQQTLFDESAVAFEDLMRYSDAALAEYFDLRNAYEDSIEYKIQVGAFEGARESLETDVQRGLYDKAVGEGMYSEKEPSGTVDAPKSAEPVGDSFMDMLNKESNSLKSVLYSETKTNLDKIGLDIDLGYAAIVKKIKELKTAGTINMNSVVDIINIVLNKEFIERKDGKEGQIKLVNELLVEALRMAEISGNFTVQETIQNINPGTYFVQINSNGNLVFTELGNNDSKTPTTISLIDFIVNSSSQSSEQFKIIKSTDANFNSPIADAVMSKEDLKGLTENLSDIFSNFGSSITEFDNLELADLKAEIVTEFNKCK